MAETQTGRYFWTRKRSAQDCGNILHTHEVAGSNLPTTKPRVYQINVSPHQTFSMRVLVVLVALLVVSMGWPGAPAAAAEAIAFPASGELKIAKMTSLNPGVQAVQTIIGIFSPIPIPQQYAMRIEGEVAIRIAGLPATRPLSAIIRATSLVIGVSYQTEVDPSVLRTPAGEVPLDVDLEVQAIGWRPQLTFRLRGGNGTGLFESVRVVGELRGEVGSPSETTISVSGTFFLGFRSVDEARAAAERGLTANTTITEEQRAQFLEQVTAALSQVQARDFPSVVSATPGGPPDRAVVEHTVRREGERLRVSLRIVVPAGDAQQPVRVVAVGQKALVLSTRGLTHPATSYNLRWRGPTPDHSGIRCREDGRPDSSVGVVAEIRS